MSAFKKLFPLEYLPYKAFNKLRQQRIVQRGLTPFGRSLHPDKWIFIVGCYNSGTTLLSNILSSHPQIGGLPIEGVSLTDSLPRPEDYGWPRMWSKCLDQVRLEPGNNMKERADRIKKQWSIWYSNNKSNLLEKSVANTARMPFLQEYFQPAYFIYIVRNGYAVAEGIRRKAQPKRWKNPIYKGNYPIENCAEQWRVADEIVQQDSHYIERFLQIYYEDLTKDPKAVIDSVTEFLGLSSLPIDIIGQNWEVHGARSEIANMNEKSFSRLSFDDIERIHRIADDRLKHHGYSPPSTFSTGSAVSQV